MTDSSKNERQIKNFCKAINIVVICLTVLAVITAAIRPKLTEGFRNVSPCLMTSLSGFLAVKAGSGSATKHTLIVTIIASIYGMIATFLSASQAMSAENWTSFLLTVFAFLVSAICLVLAFLLYSAVDKMLQDDRMDLIQLQQKVNYKNQTTYQQTAFNQQGYSYNFFS